MPQCCLEGRLPSSLFCDESIGAPQATCRTGVARSFCCRFESVKQLHIILLVISLSCMVLFVLALYRPYARRLHRDSKAVAGPLSQLPPEVDVEGHVKTVVLGIVRSNGAASLTAGAGAPDGVPGSMPPSAYGTVAPPLMLPPPAGYGWQGGGPPAMWQSGVAGAWGGSAGR
eukprot:GHRQ01029723.1.p2 GENE.GHRQ01029723.1~~GHRQ01029723.1.p2  ORF type:complete len:172 (-),score=36.57 GHRQ01029723.1:350-865(-)